MKAIVTACPFSNTEALSEIAASGIEEPETHIAPLLETLKKDNPSSAHRIDQLDDLFNKAINAAQNETIRKIVCPACNCRTVCHPEQK